MNRRAFVTGLGALLAGPLASGAQQSKKMWRLGYLSTFPPPTPEAVRIWSAFIAGLRELGYVEGQNVLIERRYNEGRAERWPPVANELVQLKVDVILVSTTPAALAARTASSSIPIVHAAAIDPVGAGLAASLSRPGGNVTGLAIPSPELTAKGLLLLKEARPGLSRVAVLWNDANTANASVWRETENAARMSGLTLHSVPMRTVKDLDNVSAAVAETRADGLLVLQDAFIFSRGAKLFADVAIQQRLVAVTQFRRMAELGALMSYGVDFADLFRKAASYVDKIFRGANPADLPFEEPTKFELVINLKTAKALGLIIPPSLLLRADQVIE
jgi:putative tryptophan/tyrosine transport system substrate-binding protein